MSLVPALSRLLNDRLGRAAAAVPRQPLALPPPANIGAPAKPQALLPPPADATAQPPRPDLRNISPRDFAEVSHDLYVEGVLSWPEYQMVGFPSELHPRYDATIGALTGEKAQPDRPRDMLGEWERRVDFERRYNAGSDTAKRAERVLQVLTWQSQPPLLMKV
jgi:hypothetical protein